MNTHRLGTSGDALVQLRSKALSLRGIESRMTLFEAITQGDLQAVEEALAATKDINEVGREGRTALIEAAALGRVDVVRLLIKHGAEPGWKDESDETAILKAGANGYPEVVSALEPHASDDERDMARAFLEAFGKSTGPEYHYDPSRLQRKVDELQKKVADVAARAANFVGHEEPLKRLERQARAEEHKKKP